MQAHDAVDTAWSAPSPTLSARYVCAGTPLAVGGYRRRIEPQEGAWLHAAITGALGRPHGALSTPSAQVPDWSLVPWSTQSGWGVVWRSARDAETMAGRRHRARIGRVDVELAFGAAHRIHAPPAYAAGAHALTVSSRSLVVIAATRWTRDADGQKRAAGKTYRTAPCSRSIESALGTVARSLGLSESDVRVVVVGHRTVPERLRVRSLRATLEGWRGSVDLIANAPARWLLECASRGIGLGARTAYGCGAIAVHPALHEAVRRSA